MVVATRLGGGECNLWKGLMKSSVRNLVMALGLVAVGVAIGAAGIYIGDTDDAPGAALIGILLMIGAVALAVRIARRKT
ncbi:MAG: hypothetical protein ACRELV_14955 [Longimicrobiales bacterium]